MTASQTSVPRFKRKTNPIIIPFGHHARFTEQNYVFDSRKATNAHMLFAGPSGTGKSHQLNRVILSLAEQGATVHVLDVHGDLGQFEDIAPFRDRAVPDGLVQTIKFGEQSSAGLPPLDLITDPEEGGPRKRANSFISLLERQGMLGHKQKAALFRLLIGLYERHGFFADDPKTWALDYDSRGTKKKEFTPRPGMVPMPNLDWFSKSEAEKIRLKQDFGLQFNGTNSQNKFWEVPEGHPRLEEALAQWGEQATKRYPTLSDLRRALWDRYVMMKTGQSAPAIRALDRVMSLASKRARLRARKLTEFNKEELERIEGQLEKLQDESLDAFKEGMAKIDSGEELEELLLWDSPDSIKGLFDRIEALEQSGIFKGNLPENDATAPVKRYYIKPLSDPEQMLFVEVFCERIFMEAKARGEADGPDTFIVLDESVKFICEEKDHILNRIVKEARKFGLNLILGSQAFMHFSDDLLMSASVKLVLGCPEMYREPMRKKLGLDLIEIRGKKINPLSLIRPKDTAMISMTTSSQNYPMTDIKLAA